MNISKVIFVFILASLPFTASLASDLELQPPKLFQWQSGKWVEQNKPQIYRPQDLLHKERITVKELILIGDIVWEVVKAGEPVLKIESDRLSVIPEQATSVFELTGWNLPQTSDYKIVYENMLGFEMVSFSYRLIFTSGGAFQNAGRYLTNVAIEPLEVDVFWGYDLDAQVETMEILNMGSEDNPIAGVELQLRWSVETLVDKTLHQTNFFIQGNGQWSQL